MAGGCTKQDSSIVIIRDGRDLNLDPGDIARGKAGADLQRVHEFALMSALVYADNDNRRACKEDFLRPENPIFQWSKSNEFVNVNFLQTPPWRWRIGEVQYDVWVQTRRDLPARVVIAFRGTDFTDLTDWWANFRWLSRLAWLSWDQYDQVRDTIHPLIDAIQTKYGDKVELIAVGHSLGGGLAQQAAYEDGRIDLVYAFAPSVVTGYFSVQPPERREENSKNLVIYRVYEDGEILAYVRWAGKRFVAVDPMKKDPKITEVRYALSPEHSIIALHNMEDFACRLQEVYLFVNKANEN